MPLGSRAAVLAALALAGCAPPNTPAEIMAVRDQVRAAHRGQARECFVPQTEIRRAWNTNQLTMLADSGWCGVWLWHGGGAWDAVDVVTPPANGTLTTEVKVAGENKTVLRYRPHTGFAGADRFEVLLWPNHVHEVVNVTVLAWGPPA